MTVDTTITWLLELFEKRIFKFQKIVETRPNTIETNVTDEFVQQLLDETESDKENIRVLKGNSRLQERIS